MSLQAQEEMPSWAAYACWILIEGWKLAKSLKNKESTKMMLVVGWQELKENHTILLGEFLTSCNLVSASCPNRVERKAVIELSRGATYGAPGEGE